MECTEQIPGVNVYYVSEWEAEMQRNSVQALFPPFTFSFPVILLSRQSPSRLHFFSLNVFTVESHGGLVCQVVFYSTL